MPELTLRNIDQISTDIRNEEISFSHLLDDLIDHVCCDVEYEMQSGLDFHQAYTRVKQKMGSGRRLKEIQEETLYAVDSKYRKMKNTMKISGIAGTLLFGIAALFKIQHWPTAGIMLTLGAFILAFIFMPSVTVVLWKETHNRKKLVMIISGFVTGFLFISGTLFKIQHWPVAGILLLCSVISAAFVFLPAVLSDRLRENGSPAKRRIYIIGTAGAVFYIMGMLFKIQHWPASSVLSVLGLLILGIIVFPLYTRLTWKDYEFVSAKFIFMVIGILLIIIPGALINLNLQGMYEHNYFPHLEKQATLNRAGIDNVRGMLVAYSDSAQYVQMKQIDTRSAEVIGVISNIEKLLIEESEKQQGKPVSDQAAKKYPAGAQEIDFNNLSQPFHTQAVKEVLLPGCPEREELNSALGAYSAFLSSVVGSEEHEKLAKLIDATYFLPGEYPAEGNLLMLSSLHSLEVMKGNLITVESILLAKAAGK